jgi:hypothetical protein
MPRKHRFVNAEVRQHLAAKSVPAVTDVHRMREMAIRSQRAGNEQIFASFDRFSRTA